MLDKNLADIVNIKELENIVGACEQCPLKDTRINVVFGVGNSNSELLFIGEAPGFHEDRQGEPFVGAAGRLLDELLISVLGLTRKDIYIANVLKCRPPGNRDPLPEEIEVCRPFLDKQIELINPRIICTLGNHAGRVVIDRSLNISRVHGQKQQLQNRWVFPIYHPAAALYAGAIKKLLIEDFQKLGELLGEGDSPKTDEDKYPAQLGLF